METTLVKMSPKGQLVVPQKIREKAGFNPGDRFIPFPIKEGIVFKKVKIPTLKFAFEKISKQTPQKSKSNNTIADDISNAITWARKKI